MATQRQSRCAMSLRNDFKFSPCTAQMRQMSDRAHVTNKKTRLRVLFMSRGGAITHHL